MENVYRGTVQPSRKATYHLMTKAEALNWYFTTQFPIDQKSIYLLKADSVCELENDMYMAFTNPVEDTLHTYVAKNREKRGILQILNSPYSSQHMCVKCLLLGR
ncbi:hypothetical protein D8674_041690 [Pyrus ussuriensis x Pyrus communis]|uniref:Uncharacterized protein n=1 Tax=Pyrus ussuriensis x Pyrus communis TaxID=2448454 RepID=A0A5N5G3D0_9ROSA|nr:hypothetical protein D8674_041690 [Pyrus ussuriensis x Pyrus communis]